MTSQGKSTTWCGNRVTCRSAGGDVPVVACGRVGRIAAFSLTHLALRARKYDAFTNEFIHENHSGLVVVNLGCGFDTRNWRIDHDRCESVELDLPEVTEVKRSLLDGRFDCHMIGASVLDHSRMDELNSRGDRGTLLIAVGLFMYLPNEQLISLFRAITERFRRSRMIFEVITAKYTRGPLKNSFPALMSEKRVSRYHVTPRFLGTFRSFDEDPGSVSQDLRKRCWNLFRRVRALPLREPQISGWTENSQWRSRT